MSTVGCNHHNAAKIVYLKNRLVIGKSAREINMKIAASSEFVFKTVHWSLGSIGLLHSATGMPENLSVGRDKKTSQANLVRSAGVDEQSECVTTSANTR